MDAELRRALREIVPEFSLEDARTNPRSRPSPSPLDLTMRQRELS